MFLFIWQLVVILFHTLLSFYVIWFLKWFHLRIVPSVVFCIHTNFPLVDMHLLLSVDCKSVLQSYVVLQLWPGTWSAHFHVLDIPRARTIFGDQTVALKQCAIVSAWPVVCLPNVWLPICWSSAHVMLNRSQLNDCIMLKFCWLKSVWPEANNPFKHKIRQI